MQCYREEYVSAEYYSNGGGYDATSGLSTGGQYEQSMMMGGGRKQAEKYCRYDQSEAQSGYGISERGGWSTGSVGKYGQNTKTSGAQQQADQYYNRYNQSQAQCGYGASEQYQRKKVNRFGECGAYNGGSNYEDNISSGQRKQKYTSKVDRCEGGYGGSQAVVTREGGYGPYGGSSGASGGGKYYSKQQYASSGEVEYGDKNQQKMRQQKKSAEKSITYQMKTMVISSGGGSSTTSSRSNYNARRNYGDCEDYSGSDFDGEDSECSDGEYYDSDGSDYNARHPGRNRRAY